MQIREYRPSDAARLAEIFFRSVREVASRCYSHAQLVAWAPALGDPNGWNSCFTDGRITMVAVNAADEPIAFGDMETNGHVDHLFSSPEAVGTGAASAIYNSLESQARELGLTRLYVEASECALPFFEHKGFIKVRRNDFEKRGVPMHNYTMEKSLAPPSHSKRLARPRSIELSRMKDPLNFDYDLVLGQRVASIMGCGTKVGKDGINVDKVAVCMERSTLLISIDGDTDEIVLKVSEDRRAILAPARRWKSFEPLAKYVGKELGWCWTARNYKGYDDLFILSFHGIEPQIVFCGIASSLWIYMMKRI